IPQPELSLDRARDEDVDAAVARRSRGSRPDRGLADPRLTRDDEARRAIAEAFDPALDGIELAVPPDEHVRWGRDLHQGTIQAEMSGFPGRAHGPMPSCSISIP